MLPPLLYGNHFYTLESNDFLATYLHLKSIFHIQLHTTILKIYCYLPVVIPCLGSAILSESLFIFKYFYQFYHSSNKQLDFLEFC